jgi:hypothetical protein
MHYSELTVPGLRGTLLLLGLVPCGQELAQSLMDLTGFVTPQRLHQCLGQGRRLGRQRVRVLGLLGAGLIVTLLVGFLQGFLDGLSFAGATLPTSLISLTVRSVSPARLFSVPSRPASWATAFTPAAKWASQRTVTAETPSFFATTSAVVNCSV